MLSQMPAFAREPVKADLVLKNGRVYTVDGSHRIAEAMAVKNGKLVFVGDNRAVDAFVDRKTIVEDAGGKLILPGLVDAHIHPIGIVDFGGCSLQSKARTLAEIAV
jgi:predicted amidohydrolase YtcJ